MNKSVLYGPRQPAMRGKRSPTAPVAWVIGYGLLCGLASLIPIFPYVGGGGYLPLALPFFAIAPLLLGSVGGVVAALLGGIIGAFIAPQAYLLQIVDVFIQAAAPAVLVALVMKNDRYWQIAVPLFIVVGIMGWLIPFYIPGATGGFGKVPEPLYFALAAIYWMPSTLIAATSLGRRKIPNWLIEPGRARRYLAVFLTLLSALLVWWVFWTRPYWYMFNFSSELGISTHLAYSWWVVALAAVSALITIVLVEVLERTRAARIRDAIW